MPMPLRIMTRSFELLDEIDQYESLQITRSWSGLGKVELRTNRYMQGADKLQRGHIIFPHNHLNKAYYIRHKEIELDENGKATENWVIIALPLKSWMEQRITYPPAHTAYDNKQAKAETVMLHYVTNNAINPVELKRKMPALVLAPNLMRGQTVSWSSRYKGLAEEMEEIGNLSGLGWNIVPDPDTKQFVFKVLEGRNLTAGQSILPPVIFSPEFDSLGNLSYTESELDYKNYAIVAGQGEGIDRRVITLGDSAGFDRYELFVDARDVEEERQEEGQEPIPRPVEDIEADLVNRGNQKLAEHEQEVFLEGEPLSKSPFVYEDDYDLGDVVTLQHRDWGITMDARITEIKEIHEGGFRKLEHTFGNSQPGLIDKIKTEIGVIRPEITR